MYLGSFLKVVPAGVKMFRWRLWDENGWENGKINVVACILFF